MKEEDANTAKATDSGENKSNQQKKERMSWWRRFKRSSAHTQANIVCTVLIMLATLSYAYVSYRQLRKMSHQLTVMSQTLRTEQWSEYMACLNVQSAQATLIETMNSVADSHAMAEASIQAASADIESQRALVDFMPRAPQPNEFFTKNMGIPFSIKNNGKTTAINLVIHAKAVIMSKGDVLRLTNQGAMYFRAINVEPGKDFPGNGEGVYNAFTPTIVVYDHDGSSVPNASRRVGDFRRGDATVFVYGNMRYSDFGGVHKVRFCFPLSLMAGGTERGTGPSPNEITCVHYDRVDDENPEKPKISKPVLSEQPQPLKCVAPNTK